VKYISIAGLEKGCSQIIMGTSLFTPARKDEVFAILDAYVAHGGNTLDTSRIYSLGQSEEVLAMWLKARGCRGQMNIVSKGCHHHIDAAGVHHPDRGRVRPAIITQDLEESLERMQVDYFDIYLLHRDDPAVPVGELFACLEEHRRAGLIRAYGVSNWSTARMAAANAYAAGRGYPAIAVNSPSFSLARINEPRWQGCTYADDAYIDWHAKSRLPLFSWAAQASGFFTGLYSRAGGPNPDIMRVYANEGNWERLRRATELAAARGKGYTANHVALAYVLCQPFPVGAVIGPQKAAELLDSLTAVDLSLSEREMAWLDLRLDTL
jgi:aryl-alcohol dehydrogenase-like predicted oxidoreductase